MNKALITTTPDEIAAKLQAYAHDSEQAFSKSTMRAIKGDTRCFANWCSERGLDSIPASTDTLRAYVDWGAEKYKPATVKRHLSSIGHLHRAAQLPDPTKAEKVRLAVKRMNRTKGTRQKQARGLTMLDVERILASVEWSPRNTRDTAMIMLARDLMARSGEVVALNVADLHYAEDGSGTAIIRKSKTDQEGQGAERWLSPPTVKALKDWLRFAGIEKGAVFQSLTRGGNVKRGTRLSVSDVYRSFRRLGELAGIDDLSGHSCRVGMAQDLTANGAELGAIMQAGRWKSPTMPARYGERMASGRGAVAQLYGKKGAGFAQVEDFSNEGASSGDE
ncbi:MAG: tyrosine-type recombinase/integrase [Magnetococcales bacterium]|nr:tyrosine-type recombinase/integrase [Magnetococcales bacterium]